MIRGALLLFFVGACSAPFRSTITLTAPEIERTIAMHFPIEKSALIAAVRLDRPRVLFEEGSDRIGVEMDAIASLLGEDHVGTAVVLGRLRYEGSTGELFLDDPEVVRLDLTELSEEQQRPVRAIATAAAAVALSQIPVHRIDDPSQKAFIKSVRVQDQKLYVELGL